MIDLTGVELDKKDRANTLIVNPRWSFGTHSQITTSSIDKQWSMDELCSLDLKKYRNSKITSFIVDDSDSFGDRTTFASL